MMNKSISGSTGAVPWLSEGSALLLVAAVVTVIASCGSTCSDALAYQRDAVLAGQVWRLLTASFVHLTWSHALLNVAALLVIWALFGRLFPNRAWLLITLACVSGTGAGLLLLNPEISWYVGLSGLLHGYFTAGAVAERQAHMRTCVVMLLLVCGKLFWEQMAGALPGSAEMAGGKVIVDAHLYGAVTGLVIGWALSRSKDTGVRKDG